MIEYVILAIVLVLIAWAVGIYNGLVTLKNRVDEAWSDIDVQLKRRYDLIPNLVNTVKGYATHERELFEKVTQARTQAMGAQSPAEKAEAENMLSGTLKSLFAVSENYPDLKANQNFLELQRELTDTEDKIQASRRFYNGNVRDFNIKLEVFPDMIVANMLAYKKREFFEIENAVEKEPVQVKF
ncbi:LemA family protein [Patescibacteria group bacterium]|nr:LemA family protein [Patescibacteria group bacterium]MBU4580418.1 LemA family protein [Patescibacteria group bacterium]